MKNHITNQRGSTLITLMLFIIVTGFLLVSISQLSYKYKAIQKEENVSKTMDDVKKALKNFYVENNRYPCPAPITAGYGTADFGVAPASCEVDSAGIDVEEGAPGRFHVTGGIPVRTLGIPDEMAFDGNKKRYQYTISLGHTFVDSAVHPKFGALSIVDDAGLVATTSNVIFTIIGFGEEDNGAYSFAGNLIQACDDTAYFGENCDGDDVFTDTLMNMDEGGQRYVGKLRFEPEYTCQLEGNPATRVGFILDTSLSMRYPGTCPPYKSDPACPRIEAAIWAMHSAMEGRHIQAMSAPGTFTAFTGFRPGNQAQVNSWIAANGEITSRNDMNRVYDHICPIGGTPLALHIRAMADLIGDGTPATPNVITVIGDGDNSGGTTPMTNVATYISNNMPNLRVDIIDIANTPNLRDMSDRTGGTYYQVATPADVLGAINESTGTCTSIEIPDVPEITGCSVPDDCASLGTCPCDIYGTCPSTPSCVTNGTCPGGEDPDCVALGNCPTTPSCEIDGTCPEPETPPTASVTINVSSNVAIASGTSADAIHASLLQQVSEQTSSMVSAELNALLSSGFSEAYNAYRDGDTSLATRIRIRDEISENLRLARADVVFDSQSAISGMPEILQNGLQTNLRAATEAIFSELEAQLEHGLNTLFSSGTIPAMSVTPVFSELTTAVDWSNAFGVKYNYSGSDPYDDWDMTNLTQEQYETIIADPNVTVTRTLSGDTVSTLSPEPEPEPEPEPTTSGYAPLSGIEGR